MSNHDDLGRALRDRAEEIGSTDHPISLDDVRGRARGIRRRRMAATGLAAAAVLAVAIPAGVAVSNRVTTEPELPPASSPSQSVSPDATDGVRTVTLDNNTDARSHAPGIDYLLGGDLVSTTDGSTPVLLSNGDRADRTRHYDTLVHVADFWMALWRDDQGRSSVDFIKRGGIVIDTRRATDTLAVSQDGSQAVYATPDGKLVSSSMTDDNVVVGDAASRPPNVNPVAVQGDGTCKEDQPGGGGCVIHFNAGSVDSGGYYVTSHGIGNLVEKLLSIGGVSKDGWVDGMVSADDSGSCSVMLDDNLKEQWRTCDYTLGKFSPDGSLVLGHPAYRDGIGDGSVAILDARTGKVLVDYRNDQEAQAFINNAVWDTDGTVLATVFARGSWSLVRMTSEGDLSLVDGMQALGSDMDTVPLFLETRP